MRLALTDLFRVKWSNLIHDEWISSDWDPLFTYHQWQANLRILEIEEIKTVPYAPLSHPFVECLIGTVRGEYLDQLLFFTSTDLQRKLDQFKKYCNEQRGHSSRGVKTPVDRAERVVNIDNYLWKQRCRGLFQLPVAA